MPRMLTLLMMRIGTTTPLRFGIKTLDGVLVVFFWLSLSSPSFFSFLHFHLLLSLYFYAISSNDRVDIAQQAIASGQPIPEDVKPTAARNSDYLWKGGITHIATGTGLVIMFSIWGSNTLIGIGCLLICFGIGQLVIAKTSRKDNDKIE